MVLLMRRCLPHRKDGQSLSLTARASGSTVARLRRRATRHRAQKGTLPRPASDARGASDVSAPGTRSDSRLPAAALTGGDRRARAVPGPFRGHDLRRTPRSLLRFGPVPVATRGGSARSRAIAHHGAAKCHGPRVGTPRLPSNREPFGGEGHAGRPAVPGTSVAVDCCRPGPDKIGMLTTARCERRGCPGVARRRQGGEWTRQGGELAEGRAAG
jgi:hypothetical protein